MRIIPIHENLSEVDCILVKELPVVDETNYRVGHALRLEPLSDIELADVVSVLNHLVT